MSKFNRNEIKELAAQVLKALKTKNPELTNKDIRTICSNLYKQLKDVKNEAPQ